MKKVTFQWLEETNAEFDRQNIDANHRAELAEKKFRKEFVDEPNDKDDFQKQWQHLNVQIDKIRSYFLTQTNMERGNVRAQFIGIYYFLGIFCEVVVPFVMGAPRINALEHLFMPPQLREPFGKDQEAVKDYIGVFADTFDYGYGIEEVERRCPSDFSKELFRSANKHLKACISLLAQNATSSKAMEEARMAVEIFLKAFTVCKNGLTDTELRNQFRHHLDKLADHCIAHGVTELLPLRDKIVALPGVEERYRATELPFGVLWSAYRLALSIGIAVLRGLGGRDCRAAFKLK